MNFVYFVCDKVLLVWFKMSRFTLLSVSEFAVNDGYSRVTIWT